MIRQMESAMAELSTVQYTDANGMPFGPVWKNDIPSDQFCKVADENLWFDFCACYFNAYGRQPVWFDWTESEVHQFFDVVWPEVKHNG